MDVALKNQLFKNRRVPMKLKRFVEPFRYGGARTPYYRGKMGVTAKVIHKILKLRPLYCQTQCLFDLGAQRYLQLKNQNSVLSLNQES
jgi:hypothetical protein